VSTAMRIFSTILRRTISRERWEREEKAFRASWANFRCLLSKKRRNSKKYRE